MSEGMMLRVGVVVDGRVVEERLIGPGVDVTIGSAAGNSIVVQGSNVPKSVLFFKANADRHMLLFSTPTGRIDLGDAQPKLLADLVKDGTAEKRGRTYQIPLTTRARGKLENGSLVVLFQYVERKAAGATAAKSSRQLVLETTLWWNDNILSVQSFPSLRPLTIGPLPTCDFQVPGRLLEAMNYNIVSGSDGKFFVNATDARLSIEDLEGVEASNGRIPLDKPFTATVALPSGFRIDFRYAQAVAVTRSSPFDIGDPQPFYCVAGSALFHAVILAIAFITFQALDADKTDRAEVRRELRAMIEEQKQDLAVEAAEKSADAKKAEEAKKDEPEKKAEEKAEDAKPEPKPTQRVASADNRPPANNSPNTETAGERKERLTENVRQKTFLNSLGGAGEGGGAGLPGVRSTELAEAFDNLGGNTYAQNGAEGATGPKTAETGDDKFKKLSSSETGGDRIETQTVKTETKDSQAETKVTANVRTGSLSGQTGVGKVDPQAVASVFSRRKGAIKSCYEKELRRDNKLSGRVVLKFTIGPAGRVTDISATQNSTGVDSIAQCMIEKVQGWKFDPPEGGSVTFTYPFIFEAN